MSEAVSDDLVLRDLLEPTLLAKNILFREFIEPGRKNVECFPLYTTEQTGPDGPSATNQRHIHTGYELIVWGMSIPTSMPLAFRRSIRSGSHRLEAVVQVVKRSSHVRPTRLLAILCSIPAISAIL